MEIGWLNFLECRIIRNNLSLPETLVDQPNLKSMKRFHILILDEDRLCLGKLSSVLEKQNFKVYCANTAKSAFETLSHHTVDFFFCNIILSGSSGLEVLLKAKKSYPKELGHLRIVKKILILITAPKAIY